MYRSSPPSAGAWYTMDAALKPYWGRATALSSIMTATGRRRPRDGSIAIPSSAANRGPALGAGEVSIVSEVPVGLGDGTVAGLPGWAAVGERAPDGVGVTDPHPTTANARLMAKTDDVATLPSRRSANVLCHSASVAITGKGYSTSRWRHAAPRAWRPSKPSRQFRSTFVQP